MDYAMQHENIITYQPSQEAVKKHGAVYTPLHIVKEMLELIPESAWADPGFVFLEPACGTGNFLVPILEKRLDNDIDVLTALNTMIGMDIDKEAIQQAKYNLYNTAISAISSHRPPRNTKIHIACLIENNIFCVDDSLKWLEAGMCDFRYAFITPLNRREVEGVTLTLKEQYDLWNRMKIRIK